MTAFHQSPDFKPFEAERLLMRTRPHQSAAFKTRYRLPFLITIVVLVVLAVWNRPRRRHSVLGALCEQLPALNHRLVPSQCLSRAVDTHFELSGDLYSVAALLILALTPLLVLRQWRAYAELSGKMTKQGAISFKNITYRHRFDAGVANANTLFARVGKFWWLLFPLALLVVGGLCLQEHRRGVFASLAPGQGTLRFTDAAYATWWANPAQNPLGFALYLLIGAYGLYVIAIQNIVGTKIITTFLRVRKGIRFGADPLDRDGFHGWGPVRTGLFITYLELTIHGFALAFVGVTLPPGAIVGPYLIALLQWAAVLPLYAAFPFVFTRRRMERYKERTLNDLEAEYDAASHTAHGHRLLELQQTYKDEIAVVRALPVLPFRRVRDTTLWTIGFLADATAVWLIVFTLVNR